MLGGSGGLLRRKFFDKNGVIWGNLGVSKVCLHQCKNHNFKGNKSTTTKLICSPISEDVHVCTKINTERVLKGVWGEAE